MEQSRRAKAKALKKDKNRFLLDEFSESDVRTWTRRAEAAEKYHVQLYYALEAQRKIHSADLYRALEDAVIESPIELDKWVRICTYRYSNQPLNAYGSVVGIGGRFNYGNSLDQVDPSPFPALYIGESYAVSHREYFNLEPNESSVLTAEEFALIPNRSHAVVHVSGRLHNLLDVTKRRNLNSFVSVLKKFSVARETQAMAKEAGIEQMQLIRDSKMLSNVLSDRQFRGWGRNYGLPATCQIFGKLVWESQFDGIVYRSTRGGGRCVALFPENLQRSESRLWLSDHAPEHTNSTLDASNWQLACHP